MFNELRKYFRFLIVIVISYVKDDLESYMLYLVLTLHTNLECGYVSSFGMYLYYNACCSLVVVPLCSYITDYFHKQATIILIISLCIELLLEILLIISKHTTFTTVVIIQLCRSAAHTQNYNSIWKLFKIKAYNDHISTNKGSNQALLDHNDEEMNINQDELSNDDSIVGVVEETKIFTNIGICAIICEVSIDVIIFSSAYIMLDKLNYNLYDVASMIFIATIVFSALAILVSLSLTSSYIYSDHHNASSLPPPPPLQQHQQQQQSMILNNNNDKCFDYYRNGLNNVFSTKMVRYIMLHAFSLYIIWQLMYNAEPLSLATSSNQHHKTIDNNCGGFFVNLLKQAFVTNAVFAMGGVLFITVIMKISPVKYFEIVYPILAIYMLIATCVFFFHVTYTPKLILASTLAVIPWFLWRYDTFIAAAIVDDNYMGVLTGIISAIRLLTPIVPGLLLKFGESEIILILSACFIAFSLIISLIVVKYAGNYLASSSLL